MYGYVYGIREMDSKCDYRKNTGTGTGRGQFHFSKYGVRNDLNYVKYGRSTEGKCSHILVQVRDGVRTFQNRGVRTEFVPVHALRNMPCTHIY